MSIVVADLDARITARAPHEATCPQKMPYQTREYAHAVALWMAILHGEDFEEYACSCCGVWHVGHVYPRPQKRRPGPSEDHPWKED